MLYKQVGSLNMPMIGVGTYGVPEKVMPLIFQYAISYGASYFDSAYRYENESFIGRCFERGDIRRDEVLLGTKLSYSQQMFGDIHKAVDDSLRNLKTDYIDVYYIHSPKSNSYCADWEMLLGIKEKGKIRELAVSNFGITQLEELYCETGVYPVLNQIEIHLGCWPQEVIQYCKSRNIAIQASCPLSRMSKKILGNREVIKMSCKYQKSFAQISLRWLLQQNILSVPRTENIEHLKENYAIFDFNLSDDDMIILNNTTIRGEEI